jgi:WD40 repeat protein
MALGPKNAGLALSTELGVLELWSYGGVGRDISMSDTPIILSSLCFSPSGETLAVGSGSLRTSVTAKSDRSVTLLQTETLAAIRHLEGPGGSIHACAFSHDAQYFATGGLDGSLCVWDLANKTLRRRIIYESSVTSIFFSASGDRLVVATLRHGLSFLNTITWEPFGTSFGPTGIFAASGNDDLEIIAAAVGSSIVIIDPLNRIATCELMQEDARFVGVAVSRADYWPAGGDNAGIVHIWQSSMNWQGKPRPAAKLSGLEGAVMQSRFYPMVSQ